MQGDGEIYNPCMSNYATIFDGQNGNVVRHDITLNSIVKVHISREAVYNQNYSVAHCTLFYMIVNSSVK